jgi:hypothetical protein
MNQPDPEIEVGASRDRIATDTNERLIDAPSFIYGAGAGLLCGGIFLVALGPVERFGWLGIAVLGIWIGRFGLRRCITRSIESSVLDAEEDEEEAP